MPRRASRRTGTKPWTTCPPSTATTPRRTAAKPSAWLVGVIGAAPRQVRPGLRSGHGVICTCLIPGEQGFGNEACLVAAPSASAPGGSRTSTPSASRRATASGARTNTGKNFPRSQVWSQVWSQARGAQCAHDEANKTRAVRTHGGGRRWSRRAHRRPSRGSGQTLRGARLKHRQGPCRRLGDRVRRPRNARTQGDSRRMAAVRHEVLIASGLRTRTVGPVTVHP